MKRLFTLAAAAAVLSACTQTGGGAAGGGRNSGTIPGHLRIAIQQDVKNLNPLLNSNTTDAMIARLMFQLEAARNGRRSHGQRVIPSAPSS